MGRFWIESSATAPSVVSSVRRCRALPCANLRPQAVQASALESKWTLLGSHRDTVVHFQKILQTVTLSSQILYYDALAILSDVSV
jgi:hypothetical protein